MKFFVCLLLLITQPAFADSPRFSGLTAEDVDKLSKEFSANFIHSSVSPAHALGDTWGFEVGLVGGITDTPELEALVKRADPTNEVSRIPYAALMGAVTVPYSFTAEFNLLPEITVADVDLSVYSAGVKWTFSDLFIKDIPILNGFSFAARAHASVSEFNYTQNVTVSSVTVQTPIEITNTSYGVDLIASYDILLFEPYVVLGYANGDMEVEVQTAGTTTDFFAVNSLKNLDASNSSARIAAGLQLDLLFTHLAVEYANSFGVDKYMGKFSFYF